MPDYLIAPSILSADFARLGDEVDNVLAAGADMVHFDVMDNHYVPNLTIGPLVCEALRKHGVEAPIDVHLMVRPVDRIIPDISNTISTLSSTCSRWFSGVAGLNTRPERQPLSRISDRLRSICSEASG